MISRRYRVLAVLALLAAITSISMAFALLSRDLLIVGQAELDPANWNIRFQNLTLPQVVDDVTEISPPILNSTTISGFDLVFDAADSHIIYGFEIANLGTIDAEVASIDSNVMSCVGTGTTKVADETMVCDKIVFEIVYDTTNVAVAVGDTLLKTDVKPAKMIVKYIGTGIPTNNVKISNIGTKITYRQK